MSVITILILYVFIQLNFDLISHNFGTKVSQFIDSYQFLVLIAFVLIACLWQLFYRSVQFMLFTTLLRTAFAWSPKLLCLTGISVVTVFLSFTDLLNNFVWSLVQTNLLNSADITSYYTPMCVLMIWLLIARLSVFALITGCVVSCYGFSLPAVPLMSLKKSLLSFNHVTLYIAILVIYSSSNQVATLWDFAPLNNSSVIASTLYDTSTTYIGLSGSLVDSSYLVS